MTAQQLQSTNKIDRRNSKFESTARIGLLRCGYKGGSPVSVLQVIPTNRIGDSPSRRKVCWERISDKRGCWREPRGGAQARDAHVVRFRPPLAFFPLLTTNSSSARGLRHRLVATLASHVRRPRSLEYLARYSGWLARGNAPYRPSLRWRGLPCQWRYAPPPEPPGGRVRTRPPKNPPEPGHEPLR